MKKIIAVSLVFSALVSYAYADAEKGEEICLRG